MQEKIFISSGLKNHSTHDATLTQPPSLIDLALKVLEKNQRNIQGNLEATSSELAKRIQKKGFLDNASCLVVSHRQGNLATEKERLHKLIVQLSEFYGGDDPKFLSQYIAEVTQNWSHDLNRATACFEDLLFQVSNSEVKYEK